MTLIEQGSPRLGFETTNRFSESAYGANQEIARRSLIFDTPSRFAEGGVGQMAAGVGPGALGNAARSAMLSHPNDFNSLPQYAYHVSRIEEGLQRLQASGDSDDWRDLRDMVNRRTKRGDWTMLSQTAFDFIVDDIVNRRLQMAPSAGDSSYEMWTRLYLADYWRDEGYKISELHGVRGPAPEFPTDISAPERIRAIDVEKTYHMQVYAKEVEIRWYEGIADNLGYVPEIMRQFMMAREDTEATLACELPTDLTSGIDTTFFSATNGNRIGQSTTYGLTFNPGIGPTAMEVGVGEFMDSTSREGMPIAGMPMYLVATPIVAQRASSILRGLHVDTRGAAVEIARTRPMIEGLTVLAEPYFKTALGNPTIAAAQPSQAARGFWMLVGDMQRPPAFVRFRHRDYQFPMLLRRNPQWGMGEIEPANHLFATMIGFGTYEPRGAFASGNGTARPV